MGGDEAPASVVEGAKLAVEKYGREVLLVGDPDRMGDTGGIPVLPASEVVEMGAEPASSVRRLKDSSIVRAAEAVRDGRASAMLSAGNTGAAMAASLLRLGRIKGVARPAIAVPFPVPHTTPTTLLDCGANADCQPEWLVQFAVLGTVYARECFGIQRPRVGMLTIGEEAGKGNSMVKEACRLFETTDWAVSCDADYIGNVEGRDLMHGLADVIVADGFTGNVVLKSLEGGYEVFESTVRASLRSTPEVAATAPVVDPVLNEVFDGFNPVRTGAALLLGTRGVSLIAHGSSSPIAIANAISTADTLVDLDIVGTLRRTFGAHTGSG
jgi:glycerol-3-phosphate acyltransferase PlsX